MVKNENRIYVILFLVLVLIFTIIGLLYLNLYMSFKIGDIVLQKETNKIGIVRAINVFSFGYVVYFKDEGEVFVRRVELSKFFSGIETNFSESGYNLPYTDKEGSSYFFQLSSDGKISGILYGGFNYTFKDCVPDYSCLEWQKCYLDYNYEKLSLDILGGIQFKRCFDVNKCSPDIISSRECSLAKNITSMKKIVCGEEVIEITDSDGRIIARLNPEVKSESIDVEIYLSEPGLC